MIIQMKVGHGLDFFILFIPHVYKSLMVQTTTTTAEAAAAAVGTETTLNPDKIT